MNIEHFIKLDKNLERRFWKYADKAKKDQCWLWTRSGSDRYGSIKTKRFDDRRYNLCAHRFSLYLKTHIWPESHIYACHTCDNTKCVNPDHLFWGTSQENQIDAINKGRRKVPYKNKDEALKIRSELQATKSRIEAAEVGNKYGISAAISNGIKYGYKWGYL